MSLLVIDWFPLEPSSIEIWFYSIWKTDTEGFFAPFCPIIVFAPLLFLSHYLSEWWVILGYAWNEFLNNGRVSLVSCCWNQVSVMLTALVIIYRFSNNFLWCGNCKVHSETEEPYCSKNLPFSQVKQNFYHVKYARVILRGDVIIKKRENIGQCPK